MDIVKDLVSGGIEGACNSVVTLAKGLRTAITGELDPEKKAEVQERLTQLEIAAQKVQTDINLQEAKHPSVFVAGWRPFIGWVCGLAIFYNFIAHPLLLWAIKAGGLNIEAPALDTPGLMSLVFSLLGLGGMRTFEKLKGVNTKH